MEAHGGNEDICSICGRTMLKGERTESYVDADRAPAYVCVLCRPSAERLGWLRSALMAEGVGVDRGDRRRQRSGLLSRRRGRGAAPSGAHPRETAPPAVQEEGQAALARGPEEEGRTESVPGDPDRSPARSAKDALSRLAAPSRRVPRPVRAVPSSPEARFELALDLFNASDHVRTVTSITRSLGAPSVSVGSLSGSAGDVRLTVAWDLSWYQWAVDLTDPEDPVRPLAKGAEVSELDQPARQWNAHADEAGRLHRGLAETGED